MATGDVLIKTGTIIVLADTTDHAPGATAQNNLGTRTDQIDLTSLANASYRQSAKFDFGGGTALWAPDWAVTAAIEPVSAPAATLAATLWVGFSESATAGQDNPGNLTGADADYFGYGTVNTDADEAISQLIRIGAVTSTADADIFVGNVGIIRPTARYGIVVVKNNYGIALAADAIEMSIRISPLIPQAQ